MSNNEKSYAEQEIEESYGEGKRPTPLEEMVDQLLADLTPEQLQAYQDQGLTPEEIRAQLIEMASTEIEKIQK